MELDITITLRVKLTTGKVTLNEGVYKLKPRVCSSHLLRLVNPCCNACLLRLPPRASPGAAKGNYRHPRASLISSSG